MNINISFDPIRLLGNSVVALIGGFLGNLIAAIIVALMTPSLDGGRLYAFAGLLMLAGSMLIVKMLIAVGVAAVTTWKSATPGAATFRAFWVTGVIGFLFSMALGLAG
jgi:hypothetical protein